jgi:hypothetical protein
MKLHKSRAVPALVAVLSLCPALKADQSWNLNFQGTDGFSDTLAITGTITTASGTSPFTIIGVNLTYTQHGVPGAPGIMINDSSTVLQTTSFSPDNLFYSPSPYLDSNGLGFLLASGSGGSDFSGNVVLFYAGAGIYCVPIGDSPSFCGTLTAALNAPPSGVTCPSVSSAEVGVPFSSPAIVVTGGTPPYTFSVAGGPANLPAGLTLNPATGAVAGTPTATGAFTIQATDSTGTVIGTCPFSINRTVASNAGFLIRYAANLNMGESYVDITNTGANGAALLGPGFGSQIGNICVNVFTFDPNEELISCCSCLLTPDQTVNLGVNRDLTVKTLTGVVPTSVTIKLIPSLAGGDGTGVTCINSAASVTTASLAGGAAAWGTTLHAGAAPGTFDLIETPFTPSSLSQGELASVGGRCAAILGNASGFGICNSCRAGALGARPLAN